MGLFNLRRKSLPTVTPEKMGDTWFYGLNMGLVNSGPVKTSEIAGQRDAYLKCPPIQSIINKKIQAALNGRMMFVNDKDEETTNATTTQLYDLFSKPNPQQDWSKFFAMAKTMQQLFGRAYLYFVKPFAGSAPKQVYVLPNWLCDIQYTEKYFDYTNEKDYIKSFKFTFGNKYTQIDPADVLTWTDSSFDFISETNMVLGGGSRLVPLQDPINVVIAAYEAQESLLTSGGAIGILSNGAKDASGSIPIPPAEKQRIESEYATNYGLGRSQNKVIVTNATLAWQAMSRPTRDLMLIEGIADATSQIADSLGYPSYLLGVSQGSTFNNVSEAKKSLYQDTTIPEQDSFANAVNAYLELDKKRIWMAFDYSNVEVLQESEAEKAQSYRTKSDTYINMYEKGVITKNNMLEALDLQPEADGDRLISEIESTPPAVRFGVGGMQSLQAILSDTNIASTAKANILRLLFGFSKEDANQMVADQPNTPPNEN